MSALTSKVLQSACTFCSDTPTSPHEFMDNYAKAREAAVSCVSDLRLSSKLLTVLSRTYTLYFAMLKADGMQCPEDLPEIHEYVRSCICSSCRIAALYAPMLSKDPNTDDLVCERNLALSENEALVYAARKLRFSVLDRYGRIFAALPVLEVIYTCSELLKRGADLCRALDCIGEMRNKDFTV